MSYEALTNEQMVGVIRNKLIRACCSINNQGFKLNVTTDYDLNTVYVTINDNVVITVECNDLVYYSDRGCKSSSASYLAGVLKKHLLNMIRVRVNFRKSVA